MGYQVEMYDQFLIHCPTSPVCLCMIIACCVMTIICINGIIIQKYRVIKMIICPHFPLRSYFYISSIHYMSLLLSDGVILMCNFLPLLAISLSKLLGLRRVFSSKIPAYICYGYVLGFPDRDKI